MNHSPSPKRNWQSSTRDSNPYGSSAFRMNNMPYTSRPLNNGGIYRAMDENNDEFVVPDYKDNARILEELRDFKKTATVRESELYGKIDGLESLCNLLKKKLESYKNKCDNLESVENELRHAHDKRQEDLKKTIRDLENVIHDQEAKIVEQERTIELQRNTIKSHETVIQDQTKSIENQANTIKDHIATIEAQNATIKNQKQSLSDFEDMVANREKKIKALTESLESWNSKRVHSTTGKSLSHNTPSQKIKRKSSANRKHISEQYVHDHENEFSDEDNVSEALEYDDEDGYDYEQTSDDYDSNIQKPLQHRGSTKKRNLPTSSCKTLNIEKNSKLRSPISDASSPRDSTVNKLLQKVDTLMNYLEDCTKNNKVPNFVDGRVASSTQGLHSEYSPNNLSSTVSSRKPTENDILLFENEELSDLLKTVTDMREKVSLRKKAEISRKLLLQEIADLHKEMEGNKESTPVFKNSNNQEIHSHTHSLRNETDDHMHGTGCPQCESMAPRNKKSNDSASFPNNTRVNGGVDRSNSVIVNEEPSLTNISRKANSKRFSSQPTDYIHDNFLN